MGAEALYTITTLSPTRRMVVMKSTLSDLSFRAILGRYHPAAAHPRPPGPPGLQLTCVSPETLPGLDYDRDRGVRRMPEPRCERSAVISRRDRGTSFPSRGGPGSQQLAHDRAPTDDCSQLTDRVSQPSSGPASRRAGQLPHLLF